MLRKARDEPLRPGVIGIPADGTFSVYTQPLPQLGRTRQALDRPGQRPAIAGGHDQAGVAVAHEPPGGRSDRVAGDHGEPAVHRLVDHQPPRLAEARRGDRRHDQHVGVGVHLPQRLGLERAELADRFGVAPARRRSARPRGDRRAGGRPPAPARSPRAAWLSPTRRAAREAPSRGVGAPDEQEAHRRVPRPGRAARGSRDRRAPTRTRCPPPGAPRTRSRRRARARRR